MQMQLCLEVTERAWCDFISWSPDGYVIYRVRHDPQLHGKMLPHYVKFFSAMQRMAPAPPPLSADEKTLIPTQVRESYALHVDTDLWKYVDPADRPPSPSPSDLPSAKRAKCEA